MVDSEKWKKFRVLYAKCVNGVKIIGAKAALLLTPTEKFLDTMETLEEDFDMPRGVASRRDPGSTILCSAYRSSAPTMWTNISPTQKKQA